MKTVFILGLLLIMAGCSQEQFDELIFRKVMEYQLKDDCEDQDKECVAAIEAQIRSCMEASDWRRYLESEDDEDETQRFIHAFFPCFKDADGNAYFDLGQ
jgi:hypothetical protein